MNVLLTTPVWPPETSANGIVTYVGTVQKELQALGVDARVLTGRLEGARDDPHVFLVAAPKSLPLLSRLRTKRIMLRILGEDFNAIDGARRIVRSVRNIEPDFRPDLIEMEESFGIAARVSKRVDVPVVLRLHGPWFLNGDALGVPKDRAYQRRVALEGEAIGRARAITSPSRDLLDRVRQKYLLELPNAEVIPNPAPAVDESARWRLSSCDPNLIVYVGRFDRHKGGDLVVDAFAAVAADRPNLELGFIGPDRGLQDAHGEWVSLEDYVNERVPIASVRSRIRHLGQLFPDDVTKWRQNARVVVVASRFEVFGMVVVEALAQGCPLVAADAGGIPEIVRHGENGFLFESSNAASLAKWLIEMLDQPELAARLGERGAQDIPQRFGADAIARQTKQFYERVLQEPR